MAGEETLSLTDDLITPAAADATVFPVAPLPQLLGTKTVAGTPENFPVGGRVTYTVILRNPTAVEQPYNPVDEFQDSHSRTTAHPVIRHSLGRNRGDRPRDGHS